MGDYYLTEKEVNDAVDGVLPISLETILHRGTYTPAFMAIANAASDKTAKAGLEQLGRIMVVSDIPTAAKAKIMRQFQEWIEGQKK